MYFLKKKFSMIRLARVCRTGMIFSSIESYGWFLNLIDCALLFLNGCVFSLALEILPWPLSQFEIRI